jgi:hypothetical protein
LIRITRSLSYAALAGTLIVLYLNTTGVLRLGWQLWVGDCLDWGGATIPIAKEHFVFPTRDDQFLMIGRFDKSREIFPNDNYLTIASAKGKFDLDHLSEASAKLCKKIGCGEYKEYSYSESGARIMCIEFRGIVDSLEYREFHVFCRARGSHVLVEYHGSKEAYNTFKEQQARALKGIIDAIAKRS